MKVHLLIIDPQKDFMDDADSALGVPGANEDMGRLAGMIDRVGDRLEDIHVTLDSHRVIDIGHPGMWRNVDGDSPPPFTIIETDDLKNDIWTPVNPGFRADFIKYSEKLTAQGNYPMMVWPEHCIIGTPGHNVQGVLMDSLRKWERNSFANVDYMTKGTNAFTEHYGALEAEVVNPSDPSTSLNTDFISFASDADIIGVGGEASSHCVLSTLGQVAKVMGDDNLHKLHILTDCMSPVPKVGDGPDFPALAEQGLKDMEKRGAVLTTSDKFLA